MDAELDLRVPPHRSDVTIIEVDLAACAGHVNIVSPEKPVLLDNLLLNIGIDAAGTELVCLSPAGLIFDGLSAEGVSTTRGDTTGGEGKKDGSHEQRQGVEGGLAADVQALHLTSAGLVQRLASELLAAEEELGAPAAVVVPTFTPRGSLTERERIEEGAEGPGVPVAYPPKGSGCGAQQSEVLFVPFPARDTASAANQSALKKVQFHAQVLSLLPLPAPSSSPSSSSSSALPPPSTRQHCYPITNANQS